MSKEINQMEIRAIVKPQIPHEYIQMEVTIPEIIITGLPKETVALLTEIIKLKNQ